MTISKCYKDLAVAIIGQAIRDYKKPRLGYGANQREIRGVKKNAERFLFSNQLSDFIDSFNIDLNAEYLRKLLKK